MNTVKRIVLTMFSVSLIAVIASLSPAIIAQTGPSAGKSTVHVRAIYQDTERPVRRAEVQLFSEEVPRLSRRGVTDARGEFSFKNVPAGRYQLSVGFPGTNGSSGFNDSVVADVDGTSTVELRVRTSRGGAITGRITYPDGEPAIGAQINVLTKRGKHWYNPTFVSAGAQTDDRGIYRIYPLAPGEYVVSVIEQSLVIEDLDGGTTQTTGNKSLNPYYYGGAANYASAALIQVEAGAEVNNINITLAERTTYKVAGTIVTGGVPLAGAYLNLKLHDDGLSGAHSVGPAGLSAQANKNGQWAFIDVPDGSYDIELNRVMMRISDEENNRTRRRLVNRPQQVMVAGADVSDVLISLSEGGRVSGTIVVEGNKPLPRSPQISLRPLRWRLFDERSVGVGIVPGTPGSFLIDEVPAGEFLFTVRVWDQNYFVKSVIWNDRDLLRQSLKVNEGSDLKNVRIVLSRDVGTLTGHIVSERDKKPVNVWFMLVPAEEARWARPESFIFGFTDKDGAFKVTGAPGEYILVMQRRNAEPVTSIDYIRAGSAGPRVTLKPGEQNVELVVAVP